MCQSGAFCTSLAALVAYWYQAASDGEARPSLVSGLQPSFYLALVANGAGLSGYNAAVAIAPRYITGAEVGLVMLAETVGGPLWMLVGFGEVPSSWTLAAAALLMGTLVVHEIVSMRAGAEPLALQSPRALATPGRSPTKGADSPGLAPLGEFLLPAQHSPEASRDASPPESPRESLRVPWNDPWKTPSPVQPT